MYVSQNFKSLDKSFVIKLHVFELINRIELQDYEQCDKQLNQLYKLTDDVKEKELSAMLLEFSDQRGNYVETLRGLIDSLGGETEFNVSIAGIVKRRWMDVKIGVQGSNSVSILNECVKSEKEAIEVYKTHLGQDLPANIRGIVEEQYKTVQSDYENVLKALEKHNIKLN